MPVIAPVLVFSVSPAGRLVLLYVGLVQNPVAVGAAMDDDVLMVRLAFDVVTLGLRLI